METYDPFCPSGDSPVPHITDEELRRHVVATRRDVAAIRIALTGNELGTEGIIPEVRILQGKVAATDTKLAVWGGILSASGVALVYLKDLFNVHR